MVLLAIKWFTILGRNISRVIDFVSYIKKIQLINNF